MFFVKGLTLTSSIHASLLILLTPILITILAFWILKEKFTLLKAAGLGFGIGGSVILILAKEHSVLATNYLLGDFLILINALSYTFYFILVKPLMLQYPPLHVVRWVFTFGFIMILPFGWHEFTMIGWEQFAVKDFIILFIVIFCGTFLAYFFNVYGIQHLGAGMAGSYIYTQPILAAIIAIIFLNEELTIQKTVAGIMIFLGVFLVSYKKKSLNNRLGVIEK